MEFRKVKKSDIPEIINLYNHCFDNSVSRKVYNWCYSKNNNYCSNVMLIENKIIAHQAIIETSYKFFDKDLLVGLSSGTMIIPEHQKTGEFYYLFKETLSHFKGDMIIGFPNNNFHDIMRKVFHFNSIPSILFKLDLTKPIKHIDEQAHCHISRRDLSWRIDNHPSNKYLKVKRGKCQVIYKEYLCNSIDILYTNIINNDLVDIFLEFSKKYTLINMISIYSELLEQIGFKRLTSNNFVYKSFNIDFMDLLFPCQMIDSDTY